MQRTTQHCYIPLCYVISSRIVSRQYLCASHAKHYKFTWPYSSNAQRFQEKKTPTWSALQHHPMIYTLKCPNILNSKMSIFQYLESILFYIWNINIRFILLPFALANGYPCLRLRFQSKRQTVVFSHSQLLCFTKIKFRSRIRRSCFCCWQSIDSL